MRSFFFIFNLEIITMTTILKNKSNRPLNLGKAGGHVLLFLPNEIKEISQEQFEAHQSMIIRYMDGDMIEVIKSARKEVVADEAVPKSGSKKKVVKE
jgi:hypothetical protein